MPDPKEEGKAKLSQNPYTKLGLVIGGILAALSMSGTSLFHALDRSGEERVEEKADVTYSLLKQKVEFEAQKLSYLYAESKELKGEIRDLRIVLNQVLQKGSSALEVSEAFEAPLRSPPRGVARSGGGGGGGGAGMGYGGGLSSMDDPLDGLELSSEEPLDEGLGDEPALLEPPEELFAPQMQQQVELPPNLDDVIARKR